VVAAFKSCAHGWCWIAETTNSEAEITRPALLSVHSGPTLPREESPEMRCGLRQSAPQCPLWDLLWSARRGRIRAERTRPARNIGIERHASCVKGSGSTVIASSAVICGCHERERSG
jgi:hypothetical protein